jgi:hypothetical protein
MGRFNTTYFYFTIVNLSFVYINLVKNSYSLGHTDQNLDRLYDNIWKFDLTGFAYLVYGRPCDQFPELSRIVVLPRMSSPVLREPSFHQLAPSHPHQPLWTGSLVNHHSATKFLLIMGYVDRASRSRIDSEKVVNCMTSDSLFRVKISGTTYTDSFIWLTRNQQKEAPITDCKHVMYST